MGQLVFLPVPGGRLDQDSGELPVRHDRGHPRRSIRRLGTDGTLTRHFSALNRLCEALAIPDEIKQAMSEGVIALTHNASVQKIEADDYE